MSDLISRKALIEFARNHKDCMVDANDIARFPAADAVEVVRCRECKCWEKVESSLLGEVMCCTGQGDMKIQKAADDFCSKGERRSE